MSNSSQSRRDFFERTSFYTIFAPVIGKSLPEFVSTDWYKIEASSAESAIDEESFWHLVKRQFFIEDDLTYLNTGTYGPTLRAAYDAVCRNLFEMGANYNKAFRKNMMGDVVPKFIARIADFIGAQPDNVALTSGTTEAVNYIANGLDLKPGDEVLTTKHEHLGGIYPWLLKAKRYGITVKQIDLKTPPANDAEILQQFEQAITGRTRVLSFCHIQYTDGALLPAKQLCEMARQRGIISVVDGAQSIGMINFKINDVGCDFYAASFHKWLCSPYGCGLLYVRNEMRERLWPTIVLSFSGWDALDRNGNNVGVTDLNYAPNYPKALLKYSSNIEYYGSLYWTIALAMDFQNLIGRDRIEMRIRSLATRAMNGLRQIPGIKIHSPENPVLRTGLVSFRLQNMGTQELFYQMKEGHKIITRYTKHPGMNFDVNRFSTHIFNMPEEIDGAVNAVKEMAAK